MLLKKLIPKWAKELANRYLYRIPPNLSRNYIQIDEDAVDAIKQSIKHNYHTGWRSEKYYTKAIYEKDLSDHLFGRLEKDRLRIVPWLDNARRIKASAILEIGCGTGPSSVALAEQGATVTGIDIDGGALNVAKDRCRIYGLPVDFRMVNATEIDHVFPNTRFDFIIFFASLEHMTIQERIIAMKKAWDMLITGGLFVIIETPNRLWYFDGHTSLLPFFHWLPDELAFKYSRFSQRENFRELYREYNASSKEHFLRQGRGVSFHEIDIALKQTQDLKILSSKSTFESIRSRLRQSKFDRRYKSLLQSIYPNVHEGFFVKNLDLIIEKD